MKFSLWNLVSGETSALQFTVNKPLTHLNIYKYPRIPYLQLRAILKQCDPHHFVHFYGF